MYVCWVVESMARMYLLEDVWAADREDLSTDLLGHASSACGLVPLSPHMSIP